MLELLEFCKIVLSTFVLRPCISWIKWCHDAIRLRFLTLRYIYMRTETISRRISIREIIIWKHWNGRKLWLLNIRGSFNLFDTLLTWRCFDIWTHHYEYVDAYNHLLNKRISEIFSMIFAAAQLDSLWTHLQAMSLSASIKTKTYPSDVSWWWRDTTGTAAWRAAWRTTQWTHGHWWSYASTETVPETTCCHGNNRKLNKWGLGVVADSF